MRSANLALLFQPFFVSAQDFIIHVAASAIPSGANVNSICYDEAGQFLYHVGNTVNVTFDGQSYNGGAYDAFITKLYTNGSRIWTRYIGGSGNDNGNKVLLNPVTSEVFLIGLAETSIDGQLFAGAYDALLVKYAANGTKVWTRLFGTATYDYAYDAFLQTQTQQLIIAGVYNNAAAVFTNDLNNGSLLMAWQLPSGAYSYGLGLVATLAQSECFLSGNAAASFDGQTFKGGSYDILLAKMNYFNGSRYWTKIWGTSAKDEAGDVNYDPNTGLVYVTGYTSGGVLNGQPSLGGADALIICTSENGTYIWTGRFGTALDDHANSAAIHAFTGTLFVTGFYGSFSGFVATFLQNGTMLQLKVPAGIDNSSYSEMAFTASNNTAYIAASGSFAHVEVLVPLSNLAVFTTPLLSAIQTPQSTTARSTFISTLSATTAIRSVTHSSITLTSDPFASSVSTTADALLTSTLSMNYAPEATTAKQSFGIIYSIIAAATVVALLVLAYCCLLRRKPAPSAGSPVQTTDFSSDSTSSEYAQATTTDTQPTSMTTLMRSNFELSMPGYLMFKSAPSFRVINRIAKGGGGVVSVAEALTAGLAAYGSKIIVKTVGPENGIALDNLPERQRKMFQQEIAIMHYFRTERNIAKLLGWSNSPACILMKFYPRGSLDAWIYGSSYKSKVYLLRFMLDISSGILAMHSAGFVHCDLKPQNVLIDTDERDRLYCCLTDFGITQIVDDTTLLVKDFVVININGLSIHYAAPETFERFRTRVTQENVTANYLMKADLYSLGVIMSELLELRHPW